MSSARNRFIPNNVAIPVINSNLFDSSTSGVLAVARLDTEDVLYGDSPLANGYRRLRANVYIDQTGMLEESARAENGGEYDADDSRSIHFVGLEDLGDGRVAVVGSMRLIYKSEDRPENLPIEDLFAADIKDFNIGLNSYEPSRFISRNENKRHAIQIRMGLLGASVSHAVHNNWGTCVAVVEPEVERLLRFSGAPITRITEPRLIEEYNDINIGVDIDIPTFAQVLGTPTLQRLFLQPHGVSFLEA